MVDVRIGRFYDFEGDRNVARAGQPRQEVEGIEIGKLVTEERAFSMVRDGNDAYTPNEADAYRLAIRIDPRPPKKEIHKPQGAAPNRSGRDDVYFPHYHPGNDRRYGHIFFGQRGQAVKRKPA